MFQLNRSIFQVNWKGVFHQKASKQLLYIIFFRSPSDCLHIIFLRPLVASEYILYTTKTFFNTSLWEISVSGIVNQLGVPSFSDNFFSKLSCLLFGNLLYTVDCNYLLYLTFCRWRDDYCRPQNCILCDLSKRCLFTVAGCCRCDELLLHSVAGSKLHLWAKFLLPSQP